MAGWDQDLADESDLVGHYYEAINTAIDAERLLLKGGALAGLVSKFRDEAIEAIVYVIRQPVVSPDQMIVFRERVKLYEATVRHLSDILEEGELASADLGEADGEALQSIIEGDIEKPEED